MFDSICIRRQRSFDPEPIDVGLLAELLLFYGRVRALVDRGLLETLIRKCGPHEFVELVTSGRLQLTYLTDGLGIRTDHNDGAQDQHQPMTYVIHGVSELQHAVPGVFQDVVGKSGAGRRLALKILPHIEEVRFDEILLNGARTDFLDPAFMSKAAGVILPELAPEYALPASIEFEAVDSGEFLTVETNLDFAAINRSWQAHHPVETGTITQAHIMSQVLNAHGDLYLAGVYSAELATDPVSEALIRHKCGALVAGRAKDVAVIDAFQELTLANAGAIREAVNSGGRSFGEVLTLLESADRFRSWLREQEPTDDLVAEFFRRATEKTWVETLPAKTIRWSVAFGIGLWVAGLGPAGLAVTSGLSAFDMFVLERFVRGWRPNQFTDDTLRPFVSP